MITVEVGQRRNIRVVDQVADLIWPLARFKGNALALRIDDQVLFGLHPIAGQDLKEPMIEGFGHGQAAHVHLHAVQQQGNRAAPHQKLIQVKQGLVVPGLGRGNHDQGAHIPRHFLDQLEVVGDHPVVLLQLPLYPLHLLVERRFPMTGSEGDGLELLGAQPLDHAGQLELQIVGLADEGNGFLFRAVGHHKAHEGLFDANLVVLDLLDLHRHDTLAHGFVFLRFVHPRIDDFEVEVAPRIGGVFLEEITHVGGVLVVRGRQILCEVSLHLDRVIEALEHRAGGVSQAVLAVAGEVQAHGRQLGHDHIDADQDEGDYHEEHAPGQGDAGWFRHAELLPAIASFRVEWHGWHRRGTPPGTTDKRPHPSGRSPPGRCCENDSPPKGIQKTSTARQEGTSGPYRQ